MPIAVVMVAWLPYPPSSLLFDDPILMKFLLFRWFGRSLIYDVLLDTSAAKHYEINMSVCYAL